MSLRCRPYATHPVLSIPELVLLYDYSIHGNLEDISSAGLVCKQWRLLALAVRWKTANLVLLLSVLVWMRTAEDEVWVGAGVWL